LGFFDIGKLQFLYITRLPSASSTQSNLRQTRSKKDHSEAARLAVGKRPGWSAATSNTFVVRQGHGVGLCQRGASAMAQHSADFREIILHYFPDTTINQFAPRHQRDDR
jgi:SpoIID/LytB domain protein